MRYSLIALALLLAPPRAAQAQVGFGVSIGINLPTLPHLVVVPGYPVYYAPGVDSNYFFYDGLYWVYQGDTWYASSWYNGPWRPVAPEAVPLYVLRVPVRYYRRPPPYFHGWRRDAPPRWGEHWGPTWEQRHRGWDRWDRRRGPRPAPLPTYQRRYGGERYPHPDQQQGLMRQHYRYAPRDERARSVWGEPAPNRAPPPGRRGEWRGPPPRAAPPPAAGPMRPAPQRPAPGVGNPHGGPPRGPGYERAPRGPAPAPAPRENRGPHRDERNPPGRDRN